MKNKLLEKLFPMKSKDQKSTPVNLGDLYTESGQTLQGSFSAVSKPNFGSRYSLESSSRDLHNALLCTVLESEVEKHGNAPILESIIEKWGKNNLAKTTPNR